LTKRSHADCSNRSTRSRSSGATCRSFVHAAELYLASQSKSAMAFSVGVKSLSTKVTPNAPSNPRLRASMTVSGVRDFPVSHSKQVGALPRHRTDSARRRHPNAKGASHVGAGNFFGALGRSRTVCVLSPTNPLLSSGHSKRAPKGQDGRVGKGHRAQSPKGATPPAIRSPAIGKSPKRKSLAGNFAHRQRRRK